MSCWSSTKWLTRCAIYTRKSTEHNLELAFNSLDAQREACEAYIRSQHPEGWRLVPPVAHMIGNAREWLRRTGGQRGHFRGQSLFRDYGIGEGHPR